MENKITNELKKYVKRQCAINNITDKAVIENITNRVMSDYTNKNYDFASKLKFKKIVYWNKKRLLAYFDNPLSVEFILSKYITRIIKEKSKVKTMSFHNMAKSIIDGISSIKSNQNFTIVKFDFVDYFNSLPSEYIYKKFLSKLDFNQEEKTLVENYSNAIPYCFAGLTPSTVIAGEVVSQKFSELLKFNFKNQQLIKCLHYGDDFILLFNNHISNDEVIKILKQTEKEMFFDESISIKHKNKVKIHINSEKYKYISKNDLPTTLEFLSYEFTIFEKNDKLDYQIGLSPLFKVLQYDKLKKLISNNYENVEKLRILLKFHSRRFVFQNKSVINGLQLVSLNYTQDKHLMRKNISKIEQNSLLFYKNSILNIFNELNIPIPYYLKDNNEFSGYSLYGNLLKNRTIVIHPKIGLNKQALLRIIQKIEPEKLTTDYSKLEKNMIEILKTK